MTGRKDLHAVTSTRRVQVSRRIAPPTLEIPGESDVGEAGMVAWATHDVGPSYPLGRFSTTGGLKTGPGTFLLAGTIKESILLATITR